MNISQRRDRSPISEAESKIILAANGPIEQWQLIAGNETVGIRDWRLGDALKAYRDDRAGSLLLDTAWFQGWIKDAKAEAAKKDLSGF